MHKQERKKRSKHNNVPPNRSKANAFQTKGVTDENNPNLLVKECERISKSSLENDRKQYLIEKKLKSPGLLHHVEGKFDEIIHNSFPNSDSGYENYCVNSSHSELIRGSQSENEALYLKETFDLGRFTKLAAPAATPPLVNVDNYTENYYADYVNNITSYQSQDMSYGRAERTERVWTKIVQLLQEIGSSCLQSCCANLIQWTDYVLAMLIRGSVQILLAPVSFLRVFYCALQTVVPIVMKWTDTVLAAIIILLAKFIQMCRKLIFSALTGKLNQTAVARGAREVVHWRDAWKLSITLPNAWQLCYSCAWYTITMLLSLLLSPSNHSPNVSNRKQQKTSLQK